MTNFDISCVYLYFVLLHSHSVSCTMDSGEQKASAIGIQESGGSRSAHELGTVPKRTVPRLELWKNKQRRRIKRSENKFFDF